MSIEKVIALCIFLIAAMILDYIFHDDDDYYDDDYDDDGMY